MAKNKKVLVAVLATVLVLAFSTVLAVPAMAEDLVLKDTIELRTRSVLMVDRSGSMEDQEAVKDLLAEWDLGSFDAVVYFDHRISIDEAFSGGGDSHICQTFDKLAKAGFTQITILTDGQQYSKNSGDLGIYTNLDVTVQLVEETKDSTKFINKLRDSLVKSNLTVLKPEGGAAYLLMDYEPPIYEVEFIIPEEDILGMSEEPETSEEPEFSAENYASEEENSEVSDTIVVTSDDKSDGKCYWWVVLILAVVIAALFDFIHELLTKKDNDKKSNNITTTAKMATAIASGSYVVADFSGSMADVQALTAKTCQDVHKGSEAVICFGDTVFEAPADDLANIPAQGQTAGWEALEMAHAKGWEKIVLVSDLEFNGKTFEKSVFAKNFKEVTIVSPPVYDVDTLQDIKKIADEVEVLYL